MPRRRMLDPSFTDDTAVAQLTRDERLFLVGCLRNADDDGRLIGNAAYLKAEIFMYDDDIGLQRMREIRDSTLEKMRSWRPDNMWHLRVYQNSGIDYLYFPNWDSMEKPSHPTPSKLPPPPAEDSGLPREALTKQSRELPEELQKSSRATPPQSSLGQSSLVKDSLGQSSGVQEDFTKFLDSEKDLTDFLTQTLQKYMPRGPTWMVEVLQQLWVQALGDRLKGTALDITLMAVKEYPPPVLAIAYARAVKYKGGKYDTAKYIKKILQEKGETYGKGRGPP